MGLGAPLQRRSVQNPLGAGIARLTVVTEAIVAGPPPFCNSLAPLGFPEIKNWVLHGVRGAVTPQGSAIGLAWGFVDALIAGAIFAWLYNLIAAKLSPGAG